MIGLGNGWVSDKHQAIIWTNDDKDPSCIIESVENNISVGGQNCLQCISVIKIILTYQCLPAV